MFQSVSDTNCGPILKRRLCDYDQIPLQWWPGVCQLLPGLVAPLHLCGPPDWLHTLDCDHSVYRIINNIGVHQSLAVITRALKCKTLGIVLQYNNTTENGKAPLCGYVYIARRACSHGPICLNLCCFRPINTHAQLLQNGWVTQRGHR